MPEPKMGMKDMIYMVVLIAGLGGSWYIQRDQVQRNRDDIVELKAADKTMATAEAVDKLEAKIDNINTLIVKLLVNAGIQP